MKDATMTRSEWMTVLALSHPSDIEERLEGVGPLPQFSFVRRPHHASVALRARSSRTGVLFEPGEMTMTRCIIKIDPDVFGYAYVGGRNLRHAALAALLDAVLQRGGDQQMLVQTLISELKSLIDRRQEQVRRQAQASAVDFSVQMQGE